MCYYVDTQITRKAVKEIYGVYTEKADFKSAIFLNGFSHPEIPVIFDESPDTLSTASWGLIPFWAKDRAIQKQTLNAKIETIKEKPSFKNNYNKRCLVLVNGFYEWKWLDDKGKQKNKHYLTVKDQEIFSLGGIYSRWTDKESGEEVATVTIVTTQANELMAEIHNSKHRMPVILHHKIEKEWLSDRDIETFAFPNHESELLAINLDMNDEPTTLFG
ncbi:SOS response-associated peptidase [Chryseobacterium sp. 5_R23647]|uniref:SOS response-associated peptidase n=1 Tax=Chryseobacterium sp. 5_R23647 TaxID=2258964 RepID=UPI000E223673|nr:SOS response-associated peptidase [Chryseobacterium sp. 5_R23647]REC42584.1 SOS response-associated peptidase [Chryseobacterium sp. 5_R23647]